MRDILRIITPDWIYLTLPDWEKQFQSNKGDDSFIHFYIDYKAGKTIQQDYKCNILEPLSIQESYQFIMTFFSLKWSIYFLLHQIFRFNHPLKNTIAFFQNLNTKKSTTKPNFNIEEQVLKQHPLKGTTTVIIPTLNRKESLLRVIEMLERQTILPSEVVIVDQSTFPTLINSTKLNIKYLYTKKKGQCSARNLAIKSTSNEIILFLEDDVKFEHKWVENHLKTLSYFPNSISCGIVIQPNNKSALEKKHFKHSDEIAGGNFAIRRKDLNSIGLFDTKFDRQRKEDTDYAICALKKGYQLISNPTSTVYHLAYQTGGLRIYGGFTEYHTKNILKPRPFPSNHYLYLKHFGQPPYIYDLLIKVPISLGIGQGKTKTLTGWLFYIALFPLHLINYIRSYRKGLKLYQFK